MVRVIPASPDARVPVLCWARDPGEGALRALARLSCHEHVVLRVCAMADAHLSGDVAVGTVFATEGAVVPSALGTDLGCGMSVHRLDVDADDLDRATRERLVAAWDARIPSGDVARRAPLEALAAAPFSTRALDRDFARIAPRHLGTLGGGNHFVELDVSADGVAHLLVHAGSRGVGGAVGDHHQKAAGGSLGALTGDAAAAYLADLELALAFARASRAQLAKDAIAALSEILDRPVEAELLADTFHNFARRETWEGRTVLVHRKGAMGLAEGETGLIPGSMGTASYLVRGRASPLAFGSSSHGAGRVLSRKEAARAIDERRLLRETRDVVLPRRGRALVEEAPSAYRDVREVLEDQVDLVEKGMRLVPRAVLKG